MEGDAARESKVAQYLDDLKRKEESLEAEQRAKKYGELAVRRKPRFFSRLLSMTGQVAVWSTVIFFSIVQSVSIVNLLFPTPDLKFNFDGYEEWEPREVIPPRI